MTNIKPCFDLLANANKEEKELGGRALKGPCKMIITYWSSDYTLLKQGENPRFFKKCKKH